MSQRQYCITEAKIKELNCSSKIKFESFTEPKKAKMPYMKEIQLFQP